MKNFVLLFSAIFFTLSMTTSVMAADPPADTVEVSNFGKKSVTIFNHATHTDVECATCHHKAVEGEAIQKCGACHTLEEGDAPKIKAAFHAKETGKCWSCHFKKSPTVVKEMKCKDCHK